jgi:hypothetical protein
MEREELHRLVESLPEGALENARKILDRFQTWPPQPPPQVEQMRQRQAEIMRRIQRLGFTGGVGGGGSYNSRQSGAVRFGHHSFGYHEDGAMVRETHHFYEGIEITALERMRLGEDRRTMFYASTVTGPGNQEFKQELKFDLGNEVPKH